MARWCWFLLLGALGSAWTAGCGSDSDDAKGGGTAGSGASGGSVSGGSGGGGGSSASGGSGGVAGDSGACSPIDLGASWKPAPLMPNQTEAGACTNEMLGNYLAVCIGTAPPCAAFGTAADPAKAKCEQCLTSKTSDSTWAAVLATSGGTGMLNQAGCVAMIGGEGTAECAEALNASSQCVMDACWGCTQGGPLDLDCMTAAQQGVCKAYMAPSNAACAAFVNSPCLKNDLQSALTLLSAYCGPGTSDAGADASSEGGSDASADANQD